jgi:hypothetical protein
MYIEDMPLPAFIDELTGAITSASKIPVTSSGILSVWNNKGEDSLRVKIQGLCRRKRGQWALFVKYFYDLMFLPHTPVMNKKLKSRKGEDADEMDDDIGAPEDENTSSAARLDSFEKGLVYQISRTTLPNGTCCLAVTSTKRPIDR